MKEDYELGRLAEELIQSRYKDKLESYRDQLTTVRILLIDAEKKLDEVTDSKAYIKVTKDSTFRIDWRSPSQANIQYVGVDEVTEELAKNVQENKELKGKIETHELKLKRNKLLAWLYKKAV